MSLWSLIDGGASMADASTSGQRLALWVGRRMATRHPGVSVGPGGRIHPDARVHPRQGTITFGRNCQLAPGAIVQGNVRLGDDCSVQAYAVLVGYGAAPEDGIMVGNGVRIAPHAMLIAADHVFDDPDAPIHQQGLRPRPIVIEDDVWVAGRVTITAGVRVGRGSVLGAGAVVTTDIPPYSVAVGVPARVIRSRRPM